MASKRFKQSITKLLAQYDIKVNGKRDWDVQIFNERVFDQVHRGTLGLGQSYMAGDWDAKELDQFICKLIEARLDQKVKIDRGLIFLLLASKVLNFSNKRRAFTIGKKHYDIGNDLFEAMLDRRMVYTCGYWSGSPRAENLDKAQEAKLDLVCRKVGLKEGMKVLDVGGGWGSFAAFAAEHYKVEVTNISVSSEQIKLANERTKGLKVKNVLMDYRDMTQTPAFDAVVSLGMFEHVGYKNYQQYMRIVASVLKDDGLFLLHTIGGRRSLTTSDPWIGKYIFPNSMLPSIKQIGAAIEGSFIMEDWHNFGADYDKTLMQWYKNFEAAWPKLKDNYDQTFYRMWKLYLLSCAAGFRSRNIQLWQVVLAKKGIRGGYRSIR